MSAAAFGLFITFEGIEGCGKSTQLAMLRDHLSALGENVVATFEPGDGPIGQSIRSILLQSSRKLHPMAELMLFLADRAQHVRDVVIPALENGSIVLCDRYEDSTAAYQGAGRSLGEEKVIELSRICTGGLTPDLTIVLDLPVETGLSRARARNGNLDRIESESMGFHRTLRESFLKAAAREPGRIKVVNGDDDPKNVFQEILPHVLTLLTRKKS